MNDKAATTKYASWALMTLLAVAAVAFALFKARPKWERAASAECRAKLTTIGSLLQAWKGSHAGQFPADLAGLDSLTHSTHPQRWMCPSDTEHSSYDFAFPSANGYDKSAVFVRCRTHGHVCLADGSVRASTKPDSE